MASPRLTAFVPVVLLFNASNPPGISRFLATCIAATHCPRFLKPEHALCRLPPGTVIPLFDKALVSELFILLLSNTVVGECEPMLECPIPVDPVSIERVPIPAGAPAEPGPAPPARPPPPPAPPC